MWRTNRRLFSRVDYFVCSSWFWAVVGAVGLHLAILGWLGSGERTAKRAVTTTLTVPERSRARLIIARTGESDANRPNPAPARETPPATERVGRAQHAVPAASRRKSPSDQVDLAAEPVGGWVLNTSVLPPGRTLVFRVQVWVSVKGKIERWLVNPDAADQEIAQAIFESLGDTVMNPAMAGGRPVASILRLELSALRE